MPDSPALAALQKQVDSRAYVAGPGHPAWATALSSLALSNPGALALIGPAGISVTTDDGFRARAAIEPPALYLAALADTVAATHGKVALAYPPAASHLPLLFAVTAVLSTAINRAANERPGDSAGPILVVSPNLDLRSSYCDVFVKDVPLDQAYPGSRLLPNGVRERLTQRAQSGALDGVCFFLPSLTLPKNVGFRPKLIILDLRFTKWARRLPDLLPWSLRVGSGILLLYTLGDADCEQAISINRFLKFPVDHAALSGLAAASSDSQLATDWSLGCAAAFLKRTHEIREIPNSDEIERLLLACAETLEKARKADPTDLSRAHWILAALRQLPVPLTWYESVARSLGRSSIKRLISQVGYRSSRIADVGPVLQTLRMSFEMLYRALELANPRSEALRNQLSTLVQKYSAERILCITRDRVSQKALKTWLQMEAFPAGHPAADIQVQSGPTYEPSIKGLDLVLVNGALPRRYRWIAGSALAPHVIFVTYPHESDIVEQQLRYFYDARYCEARTLERVNALKQIPGVRVEATTASDPVPPPLLLDQPRRRPQQQRKVSASPSATSMADLKSLLTQVKKKAEAEIQAPPPVSKWEDLTDEEPPEETEEESNAQAPDAVSCVRMTVKSRARGDGVLYLHRDVPVECVRPEKPEELSRVLPAHLKRGDVLPRVDERGRTTLFDTIVALVDQQPSMRFAAAARRQWQTAIDRLADKYQRRQHSFIQVANINYGALLADLRRSGATVETELAVRWWLNGETIGPDSIGSIRAVGKVSGVTAVDQNASDFDRAFRKIRAVHQGIGRRLATSIRRSFRQATDPGAEQIADQLDEHLALPISELLESIDFVEVVTVSSGHVFVGPSRVGKISKN